MMGADRHKTAYRRSREQVDAIPLGRRTVRRTWAVRCITCLKTDALFLSYSVRASSASGWSIQRPKSCVHSRWQGWNSQGSKASEIWPSLNFPFHWATNGATLQFTVNNIYSIHCRLWNVNSWAEQLQESAAALCSELIFARCLECSPWVEYLGNQ